MIKNSFLVLSITLLSLMSTAQELGEIPTIKTTKDFDISGPIKSIYEITYSASFEQRTLLDSTVYLDTILSRNKETNIVFTTDGYLESYKVENFDDKAKTISIYETIYHYNADKITSIVKLQDDKLIDSTYIDYNRKGEVAEQIFFDRKGNMFNKVQYFYRYGRIFNVKVRDEEGMLLNFIRYAYDAAGNLTEQEIKGSTMQYLHSLKFRYDTLKDGSRQVNKYDYVGKYKYKSMERWLIDTRGNMTELIVTDSNKRVTENHTMKYTPKGLLRSELVFTKYKNEYTYRYEYDDNGYWKTKYLAVNGKLSSKTHRVVEYYKEEGQE